ncbi:MAG TPA: PP2C family serine/threonine-protein phosphatase [Chloroflexota bacterium]|jgi:serine/threonine protein phosphatase PrpC|nr:PP2C family serine/threonine-protein phosphatase [Chloroflexota bacterium]
MTFLLDVGCSTDRGRKRPVNEDSYALWLPAEPGAQARWGALFVVADGMGGHARGEVASRLAVETIREHYLHSAEPAPARRLAEALRVANAVIWQEAARTPQQAGMGTTVVCAVVAGRSLFITNAGDSRAYLVRHGRPRQLTRDHSWVAELLALKRLTPAEARHHRMRNVITRCLGGRPDLEVPSYPPEPLLPGDAVVLCTDGLWGTTDDGEIARLVSQHSAQVAADQLVALANDRGGPDNITVIVVRVESPRLGEYDEGTTLDLRLLDDDVTLTAETLQGVADDLRQLPHAEPQGHAVLRQVWPQPRPDRRG